MASSKNIQPSIITTSIRLGIATTDNCIGAINRNQPKAHNQLQSQPTKETKVQTIIPPTLLQETRALKRTSPPWNTSRMGANPLLPSQEVGCMISLPP